MPTNAERSTAKYEASAAAATNEHIAYIVARFTRPGRYGADQKRCLAAYQAEADRRAWADATDRASGREDGNA